MAKKSRHDTEKELLTESRHDFHIAYDFDAENRIRMKDDLRFAFDEDGQWEEAVKRERQGRPTYTFNRIEPVIDQIVGEQRQARPQIKLRAVEKVDKPVTDTFAGLIRNIEAMSDAESVYDQQFVYALAAGSGNWRVLNKYAAEDGFDQDLYIESIPNILSVVWGPGWHPTKKDSKYCFVTERITEEDFKRKYPDKAISDFHSLDDDEDEWITDDGIRIAEYYKKIIVNDEICLLSDGSIHPKEEIREILDELEATGITVEKSRKVERTKIRWVKMSGAQVLEGPVEYNWKYIPVVALTGKEYNIAGEPVRKGIVRNARDAQRVYNYSTSSIAESVLNQPKAAFVVTAKQVEGLQKYWDTAHKRLYPYLPYNVDRDAPGPPARQAPNPVPLDMIALARGASDDIKATTGFHDPSLGMTDGTDESGVAINARKTEGDVGAYVYTDNLAKSIKHTGEILMDIIPDIYDTERQIRILNDEGREEFVTINKEMLDDETGETVMVRDRSQAKFDVRVSLGPSYTTQREEAASKVAQIGSAWPQLYDIGADIIVDGMDIPNSGELSSRIRRQLIAQGVVEPTEDEQKEGLGQPAPPDPMVLAMLQRLQKDLETTDIENIGKQLDNITKALKDDDLIAKTKKTELEAMELAQKIGRERVGLPSNGR